MKRTDVLFVKLSVEPWIPNQEKSWAIPLNQKRQLLQKVLGRAGATPLKFNVAPENGGKRNTTCALLSLLS